MVMYFVKKWNKPSSNGNATQGAHKPPIKSNNTNNTQKKKVFTCYGCGKAGHIRKNCYAEKKKYHSNNVNHHVVDDRDEISEGSGSEYSDYELYSEES